MKKHRNTLYITSPEAYLRKEGETFVVEIDKKKALQAPASTIENIVCFGYRPLTPALMAFCSEKNIGISYLSRSGRFLARVYGAQKGNVLLRKEQYAIHDNNERSTAVARNIVAAKIANSRNLLQRHIRNHGENEEISSVVKSMGRILQRVKIAENLEMLRGYEGESAFLYFSVFNNMITSRDENFVFSGRSKRPPLDRINALMSFLYSLLVNDVRSALETVGLDVQVGFLHRLRPGRPSLALDVMEEFRAYIADRIVLNLVNRQQLAANDFEIKETGEIRLKDDARKEVIIAYQKRKDEVITHPLLGEKTTVGLLFHIQSMLLARTVNSGSLDYPSFYIK